MMVPVAAEARESFSAEQGEGTRGSPEEHSRMAEVFTMNGIQSGSLPGVTSPSSTTSSITSACSHLGAGISTSSSSPCPNTEVLSSSSPYFQFPVPPHPSTSVGETMSASGLPSFRSTPSPPPRPSAPPQRRPLLARQNSAPGPSPSSATAGSSRSERFINPDHHWLSEDEANAQAGPSTSNARRALTRRRSSPDDDEDSNEIGKKMLEDRALFGSTTTLQHSIHHRPALYTSSPARPTTPIEANLESFFDLLIQHLTCRTCHHLLLDPTSLPCGHTVCLTCSATTIPATSLRPGFNSHLSDGIIPRSRTSPNSASMTTSGSMDQISLTTTRRLVCSEPKCAHKDRAGTAEHRVDYVLNKILDIVRSQARGLAIEVEGEDDEEDDGVLGDEESGNSVGSASSGGGGEDPAEHSEETKRVHRTKEWATVKRAKKVVRHRPSVISDIAAISSTLIADVQSELECQVCVQLFYQPVTSPCGHTFCQRCLARSLDHSDKCPLCRRDFPSYAYFRSLPTNQTTQSLIADAFPSMLAERKASIEADEKSQLLEIPIFVCTLAWPNLPTYLHIFEPRYRLMMRRVMDGDRQFGMVLPGLSDGTHEYGTMLHVRSCEMIEDGRSIVETMGTYRFRILETGTFDGYTVGRIERVDDISIEQEEELERAALARNPPGVTPRSPIFPPSAPGTIQIPPQTTIELSTPQLMNVCLEFVQTLRSGSAPWVLQRLNNTIGPMPANPSDFSFWMAEVMPVDDHVKAMLLQITSPRERLRLLVFWIEQFRSSWWFSRGCSLM